MWLRFANAWRELTGLVGAADGDFSEKHIPDGIALHSFRDVERLGRICVALDCGAREARYSVDGLDWESANLGPGETCSICPGASGFFAPGCRLRFIFTDRERKLARPTDQYPQFAQGDGYCSLLQYCRLALLT